MLTSPHSTRFAPLLPPAPHIHDTAQELELRAQYKSLSAPRRDVDHPDRVADDPHRYHDVRQHFAWPPSVDELGGRALRLQPYRRHPDGHLPCIIPAPVLPFPVGYARLVLYLLRLLRFRRGSHQGLQKRYQMDPREDLQAEAA